MDAQQFPEPARLASHLLKLAGNSEAYEALLNWPDQPEREGFRDLHDSATTKAFQRLCRKLDERRRRSNLEQ